MAEDEQQLTVAELLNRARSENPDTIVPNKPRRRRSLEEGGVSVAQLTGELPAVKDAPVEARHSSVPIDAEDEPRFTKPESRETTPESHVEAAPIEIDTSFADETSSGTDSDANADAVAAVEAAIAGVQEESGREPEPTPAPVHETFAMPQWQAMPEPASDPVSEAAEEELEIEDLPSSAQTSVISQVMDDDLDRPHTREAAAEPDEDTGSSIWAMVGLAAVGVIAGVLIFLGFQFAWANFSRLISAAGALVVTALMVVGVKLLRTSSDALSMALAGVVGLVITFTPALLV